MNYYRIIMASFLCALSLIAIASTSEASNIRSLYHYDEYQRDDTRMIVGVQGGDRYFILQNFSDEERAVTVYFGKNKAQGVNDKSISMAFMLEPFAMTDMIFLQKTPHRPKFVSGWESAVGEGVEVNRIETPTDDDGSTSDIDAKPIFRLPPDYPEQCVRKASSREEVNVRYDVSTTGIVGNVTVINSTNECFNEETVKTVEKWIYRPKLVDGLPQPRIGVEAPMTFELTN